MQYRDTALFRAVMNDHFPMTKLLLEAEANPNAEDKVLRSWQGHIMYQLFHC